MPADRSDAACTVAGVRKPSMKEPRGAAMNLGAGFFRLWIVCSAAAARGVAKRDQRFPARHRDRIDKPLIPRHEFAFAPNWWRNEGIWHGQQAF